MKSEWPTAGRKWAVRAYVTKRLSVGSGEERPSSERTPRMVYGSCSDVDDCGRLMAVGCTVRDKFGFSLDARWSDAEESLVEIFSKAVEGAEWCCWFGASRS